MVAMTLKQLLKKPSCFFALGFGSGLAAKAPGTFGTLAAVPVFLVLQHLDLYTYLLIVSLSFIVGIWLCQVAADEIKQADPSCVVWDEFVGYWVTMIAAPTGWFWIVMGFVLFRFFDIVKPWPVSLADRKVHGGLGIMLDDVIAGVYAWILLQCLAYFIL